MVIKKGLLFLAFPLAISSSVYANTDYSCEREMCESSEGSLGEEVMRAIEARDIEALRNLLGNSRENLECEVYQNMTPLVAALAYLSRGLDTREVVRFLLDCGADTRRIVFSENEKDYNVVEATYSIRENIRRNQDYLREVDGWVDEVIAMLESR